MFNLRDLPYTESTSLYLNLKVREIIKFMILPLVTSECELEFCQMNFNKTDSRNSLRISTVDDLLRIKLNGPSVTSF